MASKADILSALRADIAALQACSEPSAPKSDQKGGSQFSGRSQGSRPCSEPVASSRIEEEPSVNRAADKTAKAAYAKVLRWVAARERSSTYLRDRLTRDGFPPEATEEALERASRARVVDDRRYADALVRAKLAAGRGLRDAEREITDLGIDLSEVEAWAEHAQKGHAHEVDRALAALRRKPPRAKRARDAAFHRLTSQGFSTDVASTASRLWAEEQSRDS